MPVRPRHVEKVRHAYGVMRRGIRKHVLTIIDQFDTQASSYTAACTRARRPSTCYASGRARAPTRPAAPTHITRPAVARATV
jgi:hypothetical protein